MRHPSKEMDMEMRGDSIAAPVEPFVVQSAVAQSARSQTETHGRTYAKRCAENVCYSVKRLQGGVKAEFREHRKLLPLALAQMLMLADQPLLSTNMTQVAKEWKLDDAERDELLGGVVSVVYFTCGAISSLLAGRSADVMKRVNVVRCFMVLGALGTFCNSQVKSFASLLLCRGVAGAALGGLLPASYAMLGDMYPAVERPHAIALVAIISGSGTPVGQFLAASFGGSNWRTPFVIVGVVGFVLSLVLIAVLREPPQDAKESQTDPIQSLQSPKTRFCGTWVHELRKHTVILVCLQAITGCVPWATASTFMTDYLAENGGLGTGRAASVCVTFGFGCFGGTVIGGKLGQFLYKKDKRLQALLMAISTWGGCLPLYMVFNEGGRDGRSLWLLHLLSFLGGLMIAMTGGNAKAILLNTVPQKSRGSLFGVYTIMDDVGKGLGPALVASWVRALGRTDAFKLGILFWLPCGLFCLLMTCTISQDDLSEFHDHVREFPMAEMNLSESSTRADATSCGSQDNSA